MRQQTPNDRFFDGPRTAQRTSEGLVELPILYFDVTNVVALFDADLEGARALLRGTGLVPLVSGDHATVALSFYEYRHTSVGSYNEVGTALLAVREGERPPALGVADLLRPPRRRKLGAYVVDLPVTTAAAWAAGREIWGYPKFVTEIPFLLKDHVFRCSVLDPDHSGEVICEISGNVGPGVPAPPLSLMTYTRLDGTLIRTHVDVRGAVRMRAPGDLVLEVGPSHHHMAEHLRTLGLAGARPRFVTTTDRFQSKLHAGTRVE